MKRSIPPRRLNAVFQTALLSSLVGFGMYFDHAAVVKPPPPDTIAALESALDEGRASPEVRQVAHWAVGSQDHSGLPFLVVDKRKARLFAFDAQGRLRGSAPVLLGASRRDDPAELATPAGRFVADPLLTAQAAGIVWINGGTVLSLHRMQPDKASTSELQLLASVDSESKRVSNGALHVAGDFYREHLGPLRIQGSVAYVLPEVYPLSNVFRTGGEHAVLGAFRRAS